MNKNIIYLIISMLVTFPLPADSAPDWINSIPYEKDAFLGVGSGRTAAEAEENARIDILMQLSSKVDSTISLSNELSSVDSKAIELCKAVINTNTLRGAEIADVFETDGAVYILMRYCDSCGSIIVESALRSATAALGLGTEDTDTGDHSRLNYSLILHELEAPASSEAVKLKRQLHGPAVALIELPRVEDKPAEDSSAETIEAEQYNSRNIIIDVVDDTVIVRLINFLPYQGELTQQQISELQSLSSTLFVQLQKMGYSGVSIIGHANPEGKDDEEEELMALSRDRAVTMEEYLKNSGIVVDSVQWMGGAELLGSINTEAGRGLNRRVDIYVHF